MRFDPKDPRSPSEQERARRSLPFQHEEGQIDRSRELRQDDTVPERVLWSRLKDRQLGGFKFRRQHAIGPYYADFYCHEAALVVEVDGSGHALRRDRDERRDRWLAEQGIRVVRFSASFLARDEGAVLARIGEICRERSSPDREKPADAGP